MRACTDAAQVDGISVDWLWFDYKITLTVNRIQKTNNEDNLFKNSMQILMDYFYLPCLSRVTACVFSTWPIIITIAKQPQKRMFNIAKH